jgi:hypothetical protein
MNKDEQQCYNSSSFSTKICTNNKRECQFENNDTMDIKKLCASNSNILESSFNVNKSDVKDDVEFKSDSAKQDQNVIANEQTIKIISGKTDRKNEDIFSFYDESDNITKKETSYEEEDKFRQNIQQILSCDEIIINEHLSVKVCIAEDVCSERIGFQLLLCIKYFGKSIYIHDVKEFVNYWMQKDFQSLRQELESENNNTATTKMLQIQIKDDRFKSTWIIIRETSFYTLSDFPLTSICMSSLSWEALISKKWLLKCMVERYTNVAYVCNTICENIKTGVRIDIQKKCRGCKGIKNAKFMCTERTKAFETSMQIRRISEISKYSKSIFFPIFTKLAVIIPPRIKYEIEQELKSHENMISVYVQKI